MQRVYTLDEKDIKEAIVYFLREHEPEVEIDEKAISLTQGQDGGITAVATEMKKKGKK